MNTSPSQTKLPLPAFLKVLTANGLDMKRAMGIAGKVYKDYNTPNTLAELDDTKLKESGLSADEDRKLLLSCLVKAGYIQVAKAGQSQKKVRLAPDTSTIHSPNEKKEGNTSSSKGHAKPLTPPPKLMKRKRKIPDTGDKNEFLPSAPSEEDESTQIWDFKEVLNEDELKLKSVVINRAPVMTAWVLLVAERMNFSRPEALSIASVYTEINAVSKGISLGKFSETGTRGREATKSGAQPYVDIMGRRSLYRTKNEQWRALLNGQPVPPSSAFHYITHSFKETTPFVMGALRLLTYCYAAADLNKKAWSLYAEFRPEVNQWGKQSEMRCATILKLKNEAVVESLVNSGEATQKLGSHNPKPQEEKPNIEYDEPEQLSEDPDVESPPKRAKTMTVEEYEAALDIDNTFDQVDLDLH